MSAFVQVRLLFTPTRNRLKVEKARKMLYVSSTWRVKDRKLNTPITDDDEDFYTQLLADDDEDAGADDAAGMDVDAAAPEVISLV